MSAKKNPIHFLLCVQRLRGQYYIHFTTNLVGVVGCRIHSSMFAKPVTLCKGWHARGSNIQSAFTNRLPRNNVEHPWITGVSQLPACFTALPEHQNSDPFLYPCIRVSDRAHASRAITPFVYVRECMPWGHTLINCSQIAA